MPVRANAGRCGNEGIIMIINEILVVINVIFFVGWYVSSSLTKDQSHKGWKIGIANTHLLVIVFIKLCEIEG